MRMLGLLALCAVTSAGAQMSNLPPEIGAGIAAIGPVWSGEVLKRTQALYRPVLQDQPRAGIRIVTDVAYGAHERQKLDFAHSEAPGQDLPVLVWIPGGGWGASNRNVEGLCCHNILAFFARHGVLAIAASYRVAPDPWPAGAADVGAAVAWARANARKYGGDPGRIYVFGHSAGAANVASYLFDPAVHPPQGPGVAGAILMSGAAYRVTRDALPPAGLKYFGADESRYAARSSLQHVPRSKPLPVLLAYAEYDPVALSAPSLELAQALCARDKKCPGMLYLRGHNHLSPSLSFNTRDEELGKRVLGFMRAGH